MSIVLWILGALLLLLIWFFVNRAFSMVRRSSAHGDMQMQRLKPLLEKLNSGAALGVNDVVQYAQDPRTRCMTYQILEAQSKLHLFPSELLTIEKASEGFLVNWLEFPTELGAAPDAIEHVEKVTIDPDGNDVYYHVFKYMTKEPHWAAKDGWMLGVVGPCFKDSKPYDGAGATFSRCSSKWGRVEPKDEARWVHENIALKRR